MMLDGRQRSRRHTNCVIGWVLLFSLGQTTVEATSGNDSHQRWLAASSTVLSSPLMLDNFPERTTTTRRSSVVIESGGDDDENESDSTSFVVTLKKRKRLASSIAMERILSINRGGSSSSSGSSSSTSSDVKYSAAASAAIQSLTSSKNTKSNSRRSSSSSSSSSSTPYIPTNLLSESALMDRETNAIYWQGGETDIFSTSVSQPYLAERGIKHIRATVLSIIIWLWIWGILSRCITEKFSVKDGFSSLSFLSSSNVGLENHHVIIRRMTSIILPIARFILLLLYSLLYLRLPQYSPKVIATTIILYLIESYSCSTRRYLSHSMNAPTEVEAYLERIRNIEPSVIWRVRCFHYEERGVWKSIKGLYKLLDGGWKLATTATRGKKKKKKSSSSLLSNPLVGWKKRKSSKSSSATATTTTKESSSSSSSSSAVMFADPPTTLSWMAKKVVTHEAVGAYKFGNWADYTLASTWKRAQSSSHSNGVADSAPFSKVTLSKLLVLKDKATREDYFAQQAAFVMMEGRRDVRAEFATSIDVEGFRSKLLAVRPVILHHRAASTTTTTSSSSSSKKQLFSAANIFFRQHIYLVVTLLGLSLPYRIWFAKHCDEIRVTVVKETCIEDSRSSTTTATSETSDKSIDKSSSSWFLPTTWGFGWGSSSVTDSVRAQELFRKSMSALSLYGSSSSPSDEEATATTTTTTEIVGTYESDRDETMTDESSTTIVSSLPEESSVARNDSIPNLSTKEQPSLDIYPISPPTN